MTDRIQHLLDLETRRAKKVEQLIELLRDPDLAEVVGRLLADSQKPLDVQHRSNGPEPIDGLRITIMSLDTLPAHFTSTQVVEALHARNHPFGTDPKAAVRDALYKLTTQGKVRIVKQGGGGILHVYERIKEKSQKPAEAGS